MRLWFYAFFMAWGMFLSLPCPFPKWDEAARERMLVCFPFIGVIVGALWVLAAWLVELINCPAPMAALILAAVPFVSTGFIHLDGFSDVSDAVLSRRDLETRRRILKDPHAGAFGVICLMLVILAQFCVFLSAKKPYDPEMTALVPGISPRLAFFISLWLIPVTTRACAALAVLLLKPMETSQYAAMNGAAASSKAELKAEGALDLSAKAEDEAAVGEAPIASELKRAKKEKRGHVAFLFVMLAIISLVPAALFGPSGLAPLASGAFYWIFALLAYKNLRGMNGDISGFALTLGELCGAAVLVITALILAPAGAV